jgi:SAM-dependent methyltransferase
MSGDDECPAVRPPVAQTTNTVAELTALRAAHERYRTGEEDLLDVVTGAALACRARPGRVLDIGAGTGNWYTSIRRLAGPDPHYVGVDVAPSMVAHLAGRVGDDARAQVLAGNAEELPPDLGAFDWVGLHFVLPHAARPDRVVACAWRHLGRGGVFVAAGNGRAHLARWRALQGEVLAALGIGHGRADAVPAPDLDAIAALLPAHAHPEVRRVSSGFSFPTVDTAMAYYAAVMWRRGLSADEAHDRHVRDHVLAAMAERIADIVRREGRFDVGGDAGFVLAHAASA